MPGSADSLRRRHTTEALPNPKFLRWTSCGIVLIRRIFPQGSDCAGFVRDGHCRSSRDSVSRDTVTAKAFLATNRVVFFLGWSCLQCVCATGSCCWAVLRLQGKFPSAGTVFGSDRASGGAVSAPWWK